MYESKYGNPSDRVGMCEIFDILYSLQGVIPIDENEW